MKSKKQVALIVLDGWGYREETEHNAIAEAKTPHFDRYWTDYPHTILQASGEAVGLPEGQMGNSEVGHSTIGAGTIIDTDLVRIGKAIGNNEFISNPAFIKIFEHVKKYDSVLHVKGLIGSGGVHSHSDHLFAFLKAAKGYGIEKVALHVFTDGRDTPPQSSFEFIKHIEDVIENIGIGFIATASGRFYAMDRDNNWDRLKKVEDALFECKGTIYKNRKPSEVVRELHFKGVLDEHLEPIIFLDETGKGFPIKENDGVFFFNFRADRARMLSKKIAERMHAQNICFVTLTEYEKSLGALVAFPSVEIKTTLAAQISARGLSQAHIAETEKFPHATYFLNGGREEPHEGEVHELAPSRKDIRTHDLAPKMRAEAIADMAIKHIKKGTNFIFVNFANADMVGHTAKKDAIIEAVEEVDLQLGRVVNALLENGGEAFITADHGNAEVNVDPQSGIGHTSHTLNPVPAILTSKDFRTLRPGGLSDIAPTILKRMDIPCPKEMSGISLVV